MVYCRWLFADRLTNSHLVIGQILNSGGGFVLKDKPISDDKRKHRIVKRQTELAVLSYVEYLAGLKVKGRRTRGGGSRVNVRKEIMRYFFHPRVGYLERRFINKALELADFLLSSLLGAIFSTG